MEVKVIASRYIDRPKTDPTARVFRIADHIVVGGETRAGRMYVGDEFRAVVITLPPGDAQEPHMHPATSHAWCTSRSPAPSSISAKMARSLSP